MEPWNDNGPSKIGIAADLPKEAAQVAADRQPVYAALPHLKHVEPVGTAAGIVEREVKRALVGRR